MTFKKMGKLTAIAIAIISIALLQTPSQAVTRWSMFRGDAAGSGYVPESLNLPLNLKWQADLGGDLSATPAVSGDRIIAEAGSIIYCLNTFIGVEAGRYDTGGKAYSSPAINGTTAYFGYDGGVVALDVTDCSMKWRYETDSSNFSSPLIANGMVYIGLGAPSQSVIALDEVTGSLRWESQTGQFIYSSPVLIGGTLVIGSNDGKLYAMDAANGVKRWEYQTNGMLHFSVPAIANNIVYGLTGQYDKSLYAIDLTTGLLLWKNTPVTTATAFSHTSSPAIASGTVYIELGYSPIKIYAFDAVTGATRWSASLGNATDWGYLSSPVVIGSTVVAARGDGKVDFFDATTGALLTEMNLTDPIIASPAVANGMIFLATKTGKLYAYYGTDATPPAITISSPASNTLINGLLQIQGQVADAGIQGFTLEIGDGAAPTEWQTIAEGFDLTEAPISWDTQHFSDGDYTIRATVRDVAGNSSQTTVPVSLDATPPSALFQGVPDTIASGILDIAAQISDPHFKSYKLEIGKSAAPTSWINVSSGTSPVEGHLATFDGSRRSGPYTLKLTAEDTLGNIRTVLKTLNFQNSITIAKTLPALEWSMVSIAGMPSTSSPAALFGNGLYKLLRWDPTATSDPTMLQYRYPDTLSTGVGMWIYPIEPITINYTAEMPDTSSDFQLTLATGWNQVGAPTGDAFPVSLIKVRRADGSVVSFASAVSDNVIAPSFFGFESTGYAQRGAADTLQPGVGYFIRTFEDTALLFDAEQTQDRILAKVANPRKDFTIKLSASSGDLVDANNFAIVAPGASEAYDTSDVEKPPLTAEKFIALTMVHPDWDKHAGRYTTETQPPTAANNIWTFDVETSELDKPVSVSWDISNNTTAGYRATLVDLQTGEQIDMAKTHTVSATVDPATKKRQYKVVLSRTAATAVKVSHNLAPGWSVVAFPVEPETTGARSVLGDAVDKLNIYQVFDGKMYDINSSEGVDIQAGYGYWVNVTGETSVEVSGMPTDPSWPVEAQVARGWNLIGNPYTIDIPFGDNLKFRWNSKQLSLSEAVTAGLTDGRLYTFDGKAYTPLPAGSALQAWKGYFMKMKLPATLIFGTN